MFKNRSLLTLTTFVLLLGCNKTVKESSESIPTQWIFESYSCAFGCDHVFDQVLKPRIGEILDFQSPTTGFDLFSECDGTLSLDKKTLSREELLRELNQTVIPDQEFTTENTGLDQKTITTAQAICHQHGNTSSTFWVISIDDKTMRVYFEGASFLKFEAIDEN